MIMPIELNHLFLRRCANPQELLGKNLGKLNTFCSRMEKQAKSHAAKQAVYVQGDDKRVERYEIALNKYKGDALEIFAEFLIRSMGLHPQIGVLNYELIDEDADMGVDGSGLGLDKLPIAVQVKYRHADYELTANEDHLTNFAWKAVDQHGVDAGTHSNLLLITTGKGLHWKTEKDMFNYKIRVLNRKRLRKMTDNPSFWSLFLESWEYSLNL